MKHLIRLFILLLALLSTSCNKISLVTENNSQTDSTITSVPTFGNNEEKPETTVPYPYKTTADLGHSFLPEETECVPINQKNNKEWEAYKLILSGDFSLIEDEDKRAHVKYMYKTNMNEDTGTSKWRYILMDTNEDGVNELFVQYGPPEYESGLFCYKNGKVVCVYSDIIGKNEYSLPLKSGMILFVLNGSVGTSRSIGNIDLMDPAYNWNLKKCYRSVYVDYAKHGIDYYNNLWGEYYLPEEGESYFYEEIGEDGMMGEPYSLTIGEWEQALEEIDSLLIPDENWEYCSEQNSTEATKDSIIDIIQKIDDRKKWITENYDNFIYKNGEVYSDYFNENSIVERNFYLNSDPEPYDGTSTMFNLYYDDYGKLIYSVISHYRSLVFIVYYQNDEIIQIDFDPIKGDLEYVLETIKENKEYSFIQDDISICLENAYISESEIG